MEWSPLVPTLIGGFLAVAGGMAAQRLTHRYTRQRESEKLLREKAEQLIDALNQHPDWLVAKAKALARQIDHQVPSPLDRAHVLQVLYFPQLTLQFSRLHEALMPISSLMDRLAPQLDSLISGELRSVSLLEQETTLRELFRLQRPYLAAVESITEAILAMPGLFPHSS